MADRKLFLTGGTSLLGKALLQQIPLGWKIILAGHKNKMPFGRIVETVLIDVTLKKPLSSIIRKIKPDLVIHAAAISDVDYCQKNQKKAWMVNVEGTRNIVEVCEESSIPVIYISSNAVFDGGKEVYTERDKPNPLNFYGRTKYEGEKIIKKSKVPWKIVRLITMYGWPPPDARQNPVTWVIEKLRKGEKLNVVNDVRLNPLYNHDAACVLWKVILKGKLKNIYHIAGSEIINRYQWALETARIFKLDPSLIMPIHSSYFANILASRPLQTIYSIEKIKREFGFLTLGVKAGLLAMRREMK